MGVAAKINAIAFKEKQVPNWPTKHNPGKGFRMQWEVSLYPRTAGEYATPRSGALTRASIRTLSGQLMRP